MHPWYQCCFVLLHSQTVSMPPAGWRWRPIRLLLLRGTKSYFVPWLRHETLNLLLIISVTTLIRGQEGSNIQDWPKLTKLSLSCCSSPWMFRAEPADTDIKHCRPELANKGWIKALEVQKKKKQQQITFYAKSTGFQCFVFTHISTQKLVH